MSELFASSVPDMRNEFRSLRIGVFLPIDTSYGREVLRGIGRYAREHSHLQCSKFSETLGHEPDKLRQIPMDGIIAKIVDQKAEENFQSLGLPVINFSGQYHTQSTPTVTTDDARVGEMALTHLANRGFRNFAFCGAAEHFASKLRGDSFLEAARQRFPEIRIPSLFVPDADTDNPFPDSVRAELADWIRSLPFPVGIFTYTDRLGIEIDDACWRAGFQVPGQVAVLGVGNDLTRIDFARVPLSSIELPTVQNGFLAARILDAWIQSRKPPQPLTLLRPQRLITRESTDSFAVADEAVAVALDYIWEHLANPIRVDEVARAAGVCRRTLEQRFRQHLRKSIYGIIQSLKFDRASELLADPSIPIADIAFSIGFANTKAFSRAFHDRFQLSPTQYRFQKSPF